MPRNTRGSEGSTAFGDIYDASRKSCTNKSISLMKNRSATNVCFKTRPIKSVIWKNDQLQFLYIAVDRFFETCSFTGLIFETRSFTWSLFHWSKFLFSVLAVSKILSTLTFLNLCSFGTEWDTIKKLRSNSSLKNLAILFRAFLAYLPPFQSYRSLKKSVNTFETAITSLALPEDHTFF